MNTRQFTPAYEEAIDAYLELLAEHPILSVGRNMRPIITRRETLLEYARAHDVVLGLAADTRYVMFINDLVESPMPDGTFKQFPYFRVVSHTQLRGGTNVGVLGVIADSALGTVGDIVLVRQERHATGTRELEIPRGFGENNVAAEVQALRELEEETGYSGEYVEYLGRTNTDSGITDSAVSFYVVAVTHKSAARPEITEAIETVRIMSPDAIWDAIAERTIKDAFTLQALALFERKRANFIPAFVSRR
jgi:ADP-ribose pyrophosphatase